MTNTTLRNFLAIDTSTTRGSVALITADVQGLRTIAQREFHTARSHNSALFKPLGEILDSLAGHPIDAILVGTGPGSYTGIRIGIAAANGLAVARRSRVVGIPSVTGISPDHDSYLAIGDARRGNGYHWEVGNGVPRGEPKITANDKLLDIIKDSSLPTATLENLPAEFDLEPQQVDLSLLVSRYLQAPSAFDVESSVEPVYLAAPFVTTPKRP